MLYCKQLCVCVKYMYNIFICIYISLLHPETLHDTDRRRSLQAKVPSRTKFTWILKNRDTKSRRIPSKSVLIPLYFGAWNFIDFKRDNAKLSLSWNKREIFLALASIDSRIAKWWMKHETKILSGKSLLISPELQKIIVDS